MEPLAKILTARLFLPAVSPRTTISHFVSPCITGACGAYKNTLQKKSKGSHISAAIYYILYSIYTNIATINTASPARAYTITYHLPPSLALLHLLLLCIVISSLRKAVCFFLCILIIVYTFIPHSQYAHQHISGRIEFLC